ncbi:centromere kinetochore component CENP-T-domain-containing protein [Microdochium trichocladiopsis]|uniref:Centromere kinetochore component CENP-T-domain-containing protein n=1 Tax=Microdochium trichocladiopsis TaxID=1682393 RepID=A0A9P8YDQ5_9PEZI|nr:centromere kinetochore component CENP-T-domain-containing protein [Microdochium trichocladiopsis]KAH7037116.1 centromere kinetochore component CENP-T-domain-containing protein [Microdochium trichocladiopsis]
MSSPEPEPTPRNNRLAPLNTPRAIATPRRRGISIEPGSAYLSASARRNFQANTPHAQAARREIDERRRTLFTPGRSHRRSLRDQRETPRDILRNLSIALGPRTERIRYSSSISSVASPEDTTPRRDTLGSLAGAYDDDDDDFPIQRPRLSLPIDNDDDDEDDDDFKARRPRISILEEEEYTSASIEAPRRVSRLDQMSPFDPRRYSAMSGPEVIQSPAENTIGIDSAFFPPVGALDDDTGNVVMDEEEIQRDDDVRRQTLFAARDSDFPPIEIPDIGAEETTFIMQPLQSSPVRAGVEESVADVQDDQGPYDDDIPLGIGSDYGGYSSDGNEPMPMPDYDDYDQQQDNHDENEEQEEDQTRPIDEDLGEVDITRTTNFDETIATARGDAELLDRYKRDTVAPIARLKPGKKTKKISRHGIEYPSLPQGVVKRLATTFAKNAGISKAKITGDTLAAIMQASDWFFEQLGDDLAAYAKHAGRKTIDESDMLTLMRRHLPRELLQEIRMPVPVPVRSSRKTAANRRGNDDEEVT